MHVGLLVVEGCFTSGVVSMLDVLRTAEAVRPQVDPSIPRIDIDLIGARRRITSASGVILPTTRSMSEVGDLDVVVVGAFGALTFQEVADALASRDGRAAIAMLRDQPNGGPALGAACTGTFALAEAGILDGRRATTSWWLGPTFRNRYTAVHLDLDEMVVTDGAIITAGAAFAHIDLALRLVRTINPVLADMVANILIIDPRTAQSSYIALDHVQHLDPLVLAFERYVRDNLASSLDITAAAAAIGTSRRTLERRVAHALGVSPIALVQGLRVERAVHLLRTTAQNADQIAPQVGYANGSTLRTLIRRRKRTR